MKDANYNPYGNGPDGGGPGDSNDPGATFSAAWGYSAASMEPPTARQWDDFIEQVSQTGAPRLAALAVGIDPIVAEQQLAIDEDLMQRFRSARAIFGERLHMTALVHVKSGNVPALLRMMEANTPGHARDTRTSPLPGSDVNDTSIKTITVRRFSEQADGTVSEDRTSKPSRRRGGGSGDTAAEPARISYQPKPGVSPMDEQLW